MSRTKPYDISAERLEFLTFFAGLDFAKVESWPGLVDDVAGFLRSVDPALAERARAEGFPRRDEAGPLQADLHRLIAGRDIKLEGPLYLHLIGPHGQHVASVGGDVRDSFLLALAFTLVGPGVGQLRVCPEPECRTLFLRRRRQQFCSPRCTDRAGKRAWRAAQEAGAREKARTHAQTRARKSYERRTREEGRKQKGCDWTTKTERGASMRGRGSIHTRTRADGTTAYVAHFRTRDGRQIARTFGKEREAARFLNDTIKQVQDRTYRQITPITFRQFATEWAGGLGSNLKPSTAAVYRSAIHKNLLPAFGASPITAITVSEINAFIVHCETRPTHPLKAKTIQNLLTLLHKLFEDARELGYVVANPLTKSRALRRPRTVHADDHDGEVDVLEPGEISALLDAVDPYYRPFYQTAVSTGMRLGELLGLRWGDLDEPNRQIRVRRSLWKRQFVVPKSKKSKRAIDVGDQLIGALRAAERERYGDTGAPLESPLFTTPDGDLIDADHLRRRIWAPALRAAKLRAVTMHSLRHSFASLLIAQGENPKYISAQMGHSSITITMDRYGHLFPNTKRTAAAKLEAQLDAAKVQDEIAR